MSGLATTTTATATIVAAYTSPSKVIPSGGDWVVVGQFNIGRNVTGRLDCEGVLSDSGLTMDVRLWDVTAAEAVTNLSMASTTSQTPVRFQGGRGDVSGGFDYQIQARVTGSSDNSDFGVLLTATIS